MSQDFFRGSSTPATGFGVGIDAGLRSYMQSIFNYMGLGLALTGLLSFIAAMPALAPVLYGTPIKWVLVFAPLGFMLLLNFRAQTLSLPAVKGLFWAFCACMGLSMGALLLMFTGESVARAFFVTAATFGATSLWGYTTKRNLAGMGAFMMMGLIGIVIASIINIFMASSMIQWVVSVASVAIFTGLTAFDVQRLKHSYSEGYGQESNDKMAVFGALSLYLNFINMFQAILHLTGTIRRD